MGLAMPAPAPATASKSPIIKVVKRTMPRDGGRWSIHETARRARIASTKPLVRAYVIQKIHEARLRGEPYLKARDKAQILLKAIQTEFTYVQDPIFTEYMTGPEWMILGVFPGGDCDDILGLLLACFLAAMAAAGIRCAAVGHGYEEGQSVIQHILMACYIDKEWVYADPCSSLPLGQIEMEPTWEMTVDPFDAENAFCDAERCLVGKRAVKPPKIRYLESDFVGVAGVPDKTRKAADQDEGVDAEVEIVDPVAQGDESVETEMHIKSANSLLREVEGGQEQQEQAGVGCGGGCGGGLLLGPPLALLGPTLDASPSGALWLDAPDLVIADPYPLVDLRPGADLLIHPIEDKRCVDVFDRWWRFDRPIALLADQASDLDQLERPMALPAIYVEENGARMIDEAWGKFLASERDGLKESLFQLNDAYEKLKKVMVSYGMDFPPNIQGVFGPPEQKIIADCIEFASFAIQMVDEVLSDKRELVYADIEGVVQLGIKSVAADVLRYIPGKIFPSNGIAAFLPQKEFLGAPEQPGTGILPLLMPLASGASLCMVIGMIFDTRGTIQLMRETVQKAHLWLMTRESRKIVEAGGDPKGIVGQIYDGEKELIKAEVDRLKAEVEVIKAEKEKAVASYNRLILVGGVALLVAGGVWAWKNFGGYAETKPPRSAQ